MSRATAILRRPQESALPFSPLRYLLSHRLRSVPRPTPQAAESHAAGRQLRFLRRLGLALSELDSRLNCDRLPLWLGHRPKRGRAKPESTSSGQPTGQPIAAWRVQVLRFLRHQFSAAYGQFRALGSTLFPRRGAAHRHLFLYLPDLELHHRHLSRKGSCGEELSRFRSLRFVFSSIDRPAPSSEVPGFCPRS